jgi:tetratricopeptide (TPR) repeat protein
MDMAAPLNPDLSRPDPEAGGLSPLIERTAAEAKGAVTHWLRTARNEQEAGRTKEARLLLEAAAERFPEAASVPHDLARLAEARRDWPEAERCWRIFSILSPTVWWGAAQLSQALRRQERIGEAEVVLAEALARFPDEAGLFMDYARLADARRDGQEACARWAMVLERFAGAWQGWLGMAWALRAEGRMIEAEALLANAQERFPNEVRLFTDHALFAEARRDWPEAGIRWAVVSDRFPDVWEGLGGQARVLREQGQPDEARKVLVQALERFPAVAAPILELARLAESLRDWTAAERWWRIWVAVDPGTWWGHTSLANVIRQQGRVDEAGSMLRELVDRFRTELGPWIALARFAEAKGDWIDASQQWGHIKSMFPDNLEVHQGIVTASIRSQRFVDAECLLSDAQRRFPNNLWFFVERAHLFGRQRDWARAEPAWQEVAEKFPSNPDVHKNFIHAIRENGNLDKAWDLLADCVKSFPAEVSFVTQQASILESKQDWTAAAEHWARCVTLVPTVEHYYIRCANCYLNADQDGNALDILKSGISVLGYRPALLRERGLLAERRFDRAEAVVRYREYVASCPGEHDATSRLANALWSHGQSAEAETVMNDAITRQPNVPELALEFARFALRRGPSGIGDFLARARDALRRFPDHLDAHLMLCDALMHNRLPEEAESTLETALERFRSNVAVTRRLADVRIQLGKWDAAFAAFAWLCREFPPDSNTMQNYLNALIAKQRWDEASDLATQAVRKFPTFSAFHIARLDIAISCGRFEEAASIYKSIQTDFAGVDVRRILFERRAKLLDLGISLPDTDDTQLVVASADTIASPKLEEIVGCFESLGGVGVGCEFGQFQRVYGAEPLGLLRWAGMEPERLADALECEFEGVGRPEQTVLDVPHGDRGEYVVSDRRFGMVMHTFVAVRSVPRDKMFVQICRRLSFLKQKLVDDLREGGKIFVYKNALRTLTDAEIERLHTAIRRYGDATLLYVRRETKENPHPTVIAPRPGLLIGHIDRFETLNDGTITSLPALSWASVVASAYRAWKSGSEFGV